MRQRRGATSCAQRGDDTGHVKRPGRHRRPQLLLQWAVAEDQHADRRAEARRPIELKVEYKRLNTFFADYTKNISRGGTFIKTSRPLPVGTEFLFKLFVPGRADPLTIHGEVQRIIGHDDPDDPGARHGDPLRVPGWRSTSGDRAHRRRDDDR